MFSELDNQGATQQATPWNFETARLARFHLIVAARGNHEQALMLIERPQHKKPRRTLGRTAQRAHARIPPARRLVRGYDGTMAKNRGQVRGGEKGAECRPECSPGGGQRLQPSPAHMPPPHQGRRAGRVWTEALRASDSTHHHHWLLLAGKKIFLES